MNKVFKELKEYIEWNNEVREMSSLKINPPLIWDIYFERYKYKIKLNNVFIRNDSNIVKYDYSIIYKEYLKDEFYDNFIKPYINIIILNDVIINKKYELILELNLIIPLKIMILNYLIC